MSSDMISAIAALVIFGGLFIYFEIGNRKQRKQIEEWRKSWF
ncbi:MAG: hypothetical protein OSJ27_07900 [Candidatus Gastranaerophilales bacterium]|nr:hypothetical protein [Candidatus Gastranaerophilales bacterium]